MTQGAISMQGKRNLSFDIMRIVAVIAVIMTHVSSGFVDSYDTSSLEFSIGNIFDSLCRFSVPLFVMVSGALLLDENKEFCIKVLFRKRIVRIVLLLAAWCAIYVIVYQIILPIRRGGSIDFRMAASSFVFGHFHLWYLYMQIGLYLMLPILRCFVKVKNKSIVLLFIAIGLVSQFTPPMLRCIATYIPACMNAAEFIEKFCLNISEYIIYFITGWALVQIDIQKKWQKNVAMLISLLCIALTILYVQDSKDYLNAYGNNNLIQYISSVGIFIHIYNRENRLHARAEGIVKTLSEVSFGVYAIHMLVLLLAKRIFPYGGNAMSPLGYIIVIFSFSMPLSFFICWVMSKIPVLKKMVMF